jgi:lipid-binding SYLF domain-containing protein
MSLTVNRRTALLGAASLSAGLVLARPAHASDQQNLVNAAMLTLDHLRTDQAFGTARTLLATAHGVMILPNIVKAGFFFGGEGGNGVLLARRGRGWSEPAFFTMGSASFGLQAGVQVSEMVMILQTARALQSVVNDHFKVGAGAGLTIATLGSNVASGSSGGLADIVVWASSSGAYAGVSIDGSLIQSRPEWDRAFYGRDVTTQDILADRVRSRGTAPLRTKLAQVA